MRSTSRIEVYHIVLKNPLVKVGTLFFSRRVKICSNMLNALIRLFYRMMVACVLYLPPRHLVSHIINLGKVQWSRKVLDRVNRCTVSSFASRRIGLEQQPDAWLPLSMTGPRCSVADAWSSASEPCLTVSMI